MYKTLDSNIISDIEYHDKTAPGSMAKELLDIWALGKSPIKIEIVQRYLQKYPLKEVAQELSGGFLKGFRLKYTGPRIHRESPNLLSAFQHMEALR